MPVAEPWRSKRSLNAAESRFWRDRLRRGESLAASARPAPLARGLARQSEQDLMLVAYSVRKQIGEEVLRRHSGQCYIRYQVFVR